MLNLNALLTSSVIIPIVSPYGTGVIINGIVLMERMRIIALTLIVMVYSFVQLRRNVCHSWMFVMADHIVKILRLMNVIVMQDPVLKIVSVSDM